MHNISAVLRNQTHGRADTPEDGWTEIAKALKDAAKETLGPQTRNARSPWFDDDCLDVTTRKNEAYKKMIQCHNR